MGADCLNPKQRETDGRFHLTKSTVMLCTLNSQTPTKERGCMANARQTAYIQWVKNRAPTQKGTNTAARSLCDAGRHGRELWALTPEDPDPDPDPHRLNR